MVVLVLVLRPVVDVAPLVVARSAHADLVELAEVGSVDPPGVLPLVVDAAFGRLRRIVARLPVVCCVEVRLLVHPDFDAVLAPRVADPGRREVAVRARVTWRASHALDALALALTRLVAHPEQQVARRCNPAQDGPREREVGWERAAATVGLRVSRKGIQLLLLLSPPPPSEPEPGFPPSSAMRFSRLAM